MFDKCTVYTIYNREDFTQISTPPNELNGKPNEFCSLRSYPSSSSSSNDYHSQKSTRVNPSHSFHSNVDQTACQMSCSSSPCSSVDGSTSCSVSPKHLQQDSTNKKGAIIKHFQLFRFTSRSCSNTLK